MTDKKPTKKARIKYEKNPERAEFLQNGNVMPVAFGKKYLTLWSGFPGCATFSSEEAVVLAEAILARYRTKEVHK